MRGFPIQNVTWRIDELFDIEQILGVLTLRTDIKLELVSSLFLYIENWCGSVTAHPRHLTSG